MHIHRRLSFVGLAFGCAFVLLSNVGCGEYLLLHYLLTPEGLASPAAGVKQTEGLGEVQVEPLPPLVANDQPPACVVSELSAAAIELPPRPAQPANCLQGDLNKDGKVDGLDIQILVNCLLAQQSS